MFVINIMDNIIRTENKICFFFPYKQLSGVPLLFSRLANQLSATRQEFTIYIIDYSDGAIVANLELNDNIILLPFEDGKEITPPNDALLIMQSILPYSIRPELKISPETRILFWNLHPDCLIPYFIPIPFFRNLQNKSFKLYELLANKIYHKLVFDLQSFIYDAVQKKSLVFMDKSNYEKTAKYLFLKFDDVEYLPVPAISSQKIINTRIVSQTELNFTWIGRLCDFKFYILVYTIKQLSLIAIKKNIYIKFSIIGDGPFKNELSNLNVEHDWFKLEILGSIKPDQLDKYLLEHTDVLAAMGTSALEGAKLGIPTILLDFSYYKIKKDYKFRWLHETIDFDLGHHITEEDYIKGNNNLNQMINDLLLNYKILSNNSLIYFRTNHEINSVLKKLLIKIKEAKLTYSEINPSLLKKSILRKIYDLRHLVLS